MVKWASFPLTLLCLRAKMKVKFFIHETKLNMLIKEHVLTAGKICNRLFYSLPSTYIIFNDSHARLWIKNAGNSFKKWTLLHLILMTLTLTLWGCHDPFNTACSFKLFLCKCMRLMTLVTVTKEVGAKQCPCASARTSAWTESRVNPKQEVSERRAAGRWRTRTWSIANHLQAHALITPRFRSVFMTSASDQRGKVSGAVEVFVFAILNHKTIYQSFHDRSLHMNNKQ